MAVKEPLTPKPPREASEVADAVSRMMRALARRASSGDLQALVEMAALQGELRAQMRRAATELRLHHGYSWADLGLALGISRQAAEQRWGS